MLKHRLIPGPILALVAVMLAPGTANAALLDANCPGPSTGGSSVTSRAQTFTAVHTGTLVRAETFISKTPGADFEMAILGADAAGPTGGALATTTIPDSAVENDPAPSPLGPAYAISGSFSPGVPVTAGQQYALYLTRPDGFLIKDREGDPCPGNQFGGAPGGGWTLSDPEYDFVFQTFVNPTNVFTVGPVKGKSVSLTLPGPGTVDISARGRSAHSEFAAGGTFTLPLPLSKRGKSKLRRKGKLKLLASITYTPIGGEPSAQSPELKLKRKHKRHKKKG